VEKKMGMKISAAAFKGKKFEKETVGHNADMKLTAEAEKEHLEICV
jgi:hypothetical protein